MIQKRIEIDANSILKLITHYTQDLKYPMPLDAELVAAGISPVLHRWIMLIAPGYLLIPTPTNLRCTTSATKAAPSAPGCPRAARIRAKWNGKNLLRHQSNYDV